MAVDSPKVICREEGNMHRMWYCTDSSTCLRSWAKAGWMGAVDHTTARTGQDQEDSPASSENFETDSLVSFTWAMASLPVHEPSIPLKVWTAISICASLHSSQQMHHFDYLLLQQCLVAGDWGGSYFKPGNINLYDERGLCYFCLFPTSRGRIRFGWHDRD